MKHWGYSLNGKASPFISALIQCVYEGEDWGSNPWYPTKINEPTQSEQMVVSCLDWVGLFFACNPCVSRAAGFFNLGHHMSPASGKQFKIRVQNV